MTAPYETISELRELHAAKVAATAKAQAIDADEDTGGYLAALDAQVGAEHALDEALDEADLPGLLTAAARAVESEAEIAALKAENERLREALVGLMDTSLAVVAASNSDPESLEAFDMFFSARDKSRDALRLARAALQPAGDA